MSNRLLFYLNGVLLSNYGIHVESCSGLFVIPKRKTTLSNSDTTTHGKAYDLFSLAKYTEREIVLNCYIAAKTRTEYFQKISALPSLFDGIGYKRLLVKVNDDIAIPYDVIRADGDGDDATPTWDSSRTLAKFKIKLIEPHPVKKVILASGTSGSVTISFRSSKYVTIGWGDGSYSHDLYGNVSISRSIPTGTLISLMGDIDELELFSINGGIVKWNILC